MSLITKCPACTTMFKVVADQLRVSDGWVRCGQCNEVFDANLNLQDDSGHVSERIVQEAVHELDRLTSEAGQTQTNLITSLPEPACLPDVVEHSGTDPFLAVNPNALHFDAEALTRQPGGPRLDVASDYRVSPRGSAIDGFRDEEGSAEPSFLRPKGESSIWMHRSVRVVLIFVCLVLCLLLVLKVVLQERDWIAASAPATIPTLDVICSAMGCALGPFRKIEAVVIDSSSFTKVRSDVYRLSLALKNTAQVSVATPALELTLTDMRDQPVIRRVFLASDFASRQDVIEAGGELSVSLPIVVKLAGSSEKISGYRLLSFYP